MNIYNLLEEQELDDLSLEELDLEDEALNLALEYHFHQLEIVDNAFINFENYNELDPELRKQIEQYLPSLEDSVSDGAGSYLGRLWDDWFSFRHRWIQGLVDLVRSKKKTIAAYRKKLYAKNNRIQNYISRKGQGIHNASFINIEKYWTYSSGQFPKSVLQAATNDYKFSNGFLNEGPKEAIKELSNLTHSLNLLKFNNGPGQEKNLELVASKLKQIPDIIGNRLFANRELLLFQTTILSSSPKKGSSETYLDYFSRPNKLTVTTADWKIDAVLYAFKVIGLAYPLLDFIRAALSIGFSLNTGEQEKLYNLGISFLDSADDYLDRCYHDSKQMSQEMEKLSDYFSNKIPKDADSNLVKTASKLAMTHASNLNYFVGKPMMSLAERQIKMAKGINYVLMRSIGRKDYSL